MIKSLYNFSSSSMLFVLVVLNLNSLSQSYLPLSGGNLSGTLSALNIYVGTTAPAYGEQIGIRATSPKFLLAHSNGYYWSNYLDATNGDYHIRYDGGGVDYLSLSRATGFATFNGGIIATSGRFSSDITSSGAIFLGTIGAAYGEQFGIRAASPKFLLAQSNGYYWSTYLDAANGDYHVRYDGGGTDYLSLSRATGVATFSGGISATTGSFSSASINNTLLIGSITAAQAGTNALAVNGSAIFNKATVKVFPWSDYVFDQDYKLPKLSELESFIIANHHLPEVPSVKEVENEGIDIGVNQALLLKKIEELTLLLINQNKTIEKQELDFTELKKYTKTLSDKIEKIQQLK